MPERQRPGPEREPGLPAYHRAAGFAGEEPAGRVYVQCQDLLFSRTDNDLSVFRFQLHPEATPEAPLRSHVAVLGEIPPADLDAQLLRLLAEGEPVELPEELLHVLAQRRRRMTRRGQTWWEGHYRPGRRF